MIHSTHTVQIQNLIYHVMPYTVLLAIEERMFYVKWKKYDRERSTIKEVEVHNLEEICVFHDFIS